MTQPYPQGPGFKATTTSAAAADKMEGKAELLRKRVLGVLRTSGALTADEAAASMGESVLSIRPRFSELRLDGLIEDTGERRKNHSGRSAIVWRATPPTADQFSLF